jgi:aldose 1-epimerase
VSVKKELFGKTKQGREVFLFTLTNKNGLQVMITNFGGRLVQLWLPDRNGHFDDVIMGFDTLDPYLIRNPYFGALVGRCANRIAGASFPLHDRVYSLDSNSPPHHLHGGGGGFDKCLWGAEILEEGGEKKLKLTLMSPEGDQGYPGNLWVEVLYSLTGTNHLSIDYSAHSDAETIVNLTNHTYFNLKGHNTGTILGHRISIDADEYLPTDPAGIPLAGPAGVAGTPFDLCTMTEIGSRIASPHEQMVQKSGFDIHYFFRKKDDLRRVCKVEEPESGRKMEVWTTKPGMQFYTANNIKDNFVFTGKGGYTYTQYCGLCLETQYAPNSPNNPAFPSIVLYPGKNYRHRTDYVFF